MDVAFKLLILNCAFVEKLFELLNIVVDVVFKLLILNCAFVEKLFKLLNTFVDVAFKLFICNCALFEKLFKLLNIVVDVVFILNIDNPEVVISPTTLRELFIVVAPEIFNVFKNVDAPEINKLLKFVLLFINVIVFVEKLFKLLNMVVDVAFKLLILNCAFVENEFKLLNMCLLLNLY